MKRILIAILSIGVIGAAGVSAYYATRSDTTPRVSTTTINGGDIAEVVVSTDTVTEILDSSVQPGMAVITDITLGTTQATGTTRRTTSPLTGSRPMGGPGGPPPM